MELLEKDYFSAEIVLHVLLSFELQIVACNYKHDQSCKFSFRHEMTNMKYNLKNINLRSG